MERCTQTLEEILSELSSLESDWKDAFAVRVIEFLSSVAEKSEYSLDDLKSMLDQDFDAAVTVMRLFIDKSKDEFSTILRAELIGQAGIGKAAYAKDKESYAVALDHLLIRESIRKTINGQYTWKDILIERLKSGRGSAIKGQHRGRALEDFIEEIVVSAFGSGNFNTRCSFIGRSGQSTEKADFAIPSKIKPRIIIEVKAYGATGSKQSDVLGDVGRIIAEKRHDTTFIFVTDGITWNDRVSDLRKLIKLQNEGFIYRIYTEKMGPELRLDLNQLKMEYNL